MKRLVVVAAALVVACTWSNSLYQARVFSDDARRAERDKLPGEAKRLWGRAVEEAESAYARSPRGARGAEAQWLAGNAAAHGGDCATAIPALQGAMLAAPRASWNEQLLLELGGCEEAIGGPTAASVYSTLLARATNPLVRRQARMRQGHVLVLQGEWDRAVAVLADEDSQPARLDRATAFANLGQTDRALAELAPALAKGDTSVRWLGYLQVFAVHNSAATDSLLDRVLALPKLPAAQRPLLIMAAARAALVFDPAAADRRLQRLEAGPGSTADDARALRQRLRLTSATTPVELRSAVNSMAAIDLADAGFSWRAVMTLAGYAKELLAANDSTAAGTPRGDLVMFGLGELARDSLGAPRLASGFFARLEREWPMSPYVGKALFARLALDPDSADAIRARANLLPGNPYLAAAAGDLSARTVVPRLEDSLNHFVGRLLASRPAVTAPDRP